MTDVQIAFLVTATLIVLSASMVVFARNLFHASLWLIAALFGVAIVFLFLEADFLAVAQVAVYIGAIAILIIFAIMLTRGVMQITLSQLNRYWLAGLLLALSIFAGLCVILQQAPHIDQSMPGVVPADSLAQLGQAMMDPAQYALPFETASLLLLATMIGAIMIAREKK
jgi:NADH-quinone oxidoreductase subunit J